MLERPSQLDQVLAAGLDQLDIVGSRGEDLADRGPCQLEQRDQNWFELGSRAMIDGLCTRGHQAECLENILSV